MSRKGILIDSCTLKETYLACAFATSVTFPLPPSYASQCVKSVSLCQNPLPEFLEEATLTYNSVNGYVTLGNLSPIEQQFDFQYCIYNFNPTIQITRVLQRILIVPLECAGPKGDQGPQGAVGAKGDQGNQGAVGAKGDQGDQGMKGDQGDQGMKGDQGDQGFKGDQGDQGMKGDQGDQGMKGDQGDQGFKGDQGDQGFKGDQGDQGFKGDQGDQGMKGDQGDQGIKGDQGDQGNQGNQGNQGDQGVVTPIYGFVTNSAPDVWQFAPNPTFMALTPPAAAAQINNWPSIGQGVFLPASNIIFTVNTPIIVRFSVIMTVVTSVLNQQMNVLFGSTGVAVTDTASVGPNTRFTFHAHGLAVLSDNFQILIIPPVTSIDPIVGELSIEFVDYYNPIQ